jgi:hypothetical protein
MNRRRKTAIAEIAMPLMIQGHRPLQHNCVALDKVSHKANQLYSPSHVARRTSQDDGTCGDLRQEECNVLKNLILGLIKE